jgi:hypothetical protein
MITEREGRRRGPIGGPKVWVRERKPTEADSRS